MKCTVSPDCQRLQHLQFLLGNALLIEEKKWKVPCFIDSTIKGTDISPKQYEKVILWMQKLRLHFRFYPETFGLAVSILNRMLASVKAQVKYLRCIAISCLYLAAKTNEEDEIIPTVTQLTEEIGSLYSTAEILRMERIILDKLRWDLYTATPMDFLNICHAMVMINWPYLFRSFTQMNPSRHVAFLTKQLQHCMACHQLLQFRGSTVALAIITLELERMADGWFPVIMDLMKKINVDSAELIHCKELAYQCLEDSPNQFYFSSANNYTNGDDQEESPGYCIPSASYCPHTQARISNHQSTTPSNECAHEDLMETDHFYDGFQHLYSEDMSNTEEMSTVLVNAGPQLEEGSMEDAQS